MQSWILGGCLATVAAGGVYFVATGGGSETHCGPCVSARTPPQAPEPKLAPTVTELHPVVEVVDVEAVLSKPTPPPATRFISFDEPPLAPPPANKTGDAPSIIQTAFVEPVTIEVAPMPRLVKPPTKRGEPMPLATSESSF